MTGSITRHRRDRLIGFVYLLYFLTAIFSAFLSKDIIVPGDAAGTANNILAHESLFRSSFSVNLIATTLYLALTALLYNLFKPVSRNLSLIAAFFSIMGCATQTFGSIFQLAPLVIRSGSALPRLAISNEEQLQALSLVFLDLQVQAFNIGLIFFAFYCLLIGYLILRSTFIPKILGMLMMVAGMGWLTFLAPPLAERLSRYTQVLGFAAEALLMLWLLVAGIDVRQWKEKPTA